MRTQRAGVWSLEAVWVWRSSIARRRRPVRCWAVRGGVWIGPVVSHRRIHVTIRPSAVNTGPAVAQCPMIHAWSKHERDGARSSMGRRSAVGRGGGGGGDTEALEWSLHWSIAGQSRVLLRCNSWRGVLCSRAHVGPTWLLVLLQIHTPRTDGFCGKHRHWESSVID